MQLGPAVGCFSREPGRLSQTAGSRARRSSKCKRRTNGADKVEGSDSSPSTAPSHRFNIGMPTGLHARTYSDAQVRTGHVYV